MYEAIACYGLGVAVVSFFGRIEGGLFAKSSDMGADLIGKLQFNSVEDSYQNPLVIADLIGDNIVNI